MRLEQVKAFGRETAIPLALDTMREMPEDGDNPRLFPTVYLLEEDGSFGVMVVAGGFPNSQAQFAFARFVEQACQANGNVVGLVYIAETWISGLGATADLPEYRRTIGMPSKDPNRRTGVITILAAPDSMDMWVQPVTIEDDGRLILDPIADQAKGFTVSRLMPNPWNYRGKGLDG